MTRPIIFLPVFSLFCLVNGSQAATPVSKVFTETNGAAGNSIMVWNRGLDGTLTFAQTVATGALGTGSGLGSQGALLLTSHYLLAVNAGSNSITVLNIGSTKLSVASTSPSGGMQPVSLTSSGTKVYVLNAGNSANNSPGNISGFTFDTLHGTLTPIPGSTQPLSAANVAPAQVSFNKQGNFLIVAEKGTSLLDTYPVNASGVAGPPTSYVSHGPTPYGFQTGTHNRFYVSEAFAGLGNVSATSSYALSANGVPEVISGSVTTNFAAACWLVLTPNEAYAYVTDTPSAIISVYSISNTGVLTLLPQFNTNTGAGSSPLDEIISADGEFLYVLNGGAHTIGAYAINTDGSLRAIQGATAVPAGATGVAVR